MAVWLTFSGSSSKLFERDRVDKRNRHEQNCWKLGLESAESCSDLPFGFVTCSYRQSTGEQILPIRDCFGSSGSRNISQEQVLQNHSK